MELGLDSHTDGPFEVVEVGGEIDVYTAPRLREAIVAAIEADHTRLIIDVEKVEFLDSTGLGCWSAHSRRSAPTGAPSTSSARRSASSRSSTSPASTRSSVSILGCRGDRRPRLTPVVTRRARGWFPSTGNSCPVHGGNSWFTRPCCASRGHQSHPGQHDIRVRRGRDRGPRTHPGGGLPRRGTQARRRHREDAGDRTGRPGGRIRLSDPSVQDPRASSWSSSRALLLVLPPDDWGIKIGRYSSSSCRRGVLGGHRLPRHVARRSRERPRRRGRPERGPRPGHAHRVPHRRPRRHADRRPRPARRGRSRADLRG